MHLRGLYRTKKWIIKEVMSNPPDLRARCSPGATVSGNSASGWSLSIPGGPAGRYQLAQLDDYTRLPRRLFPWRPPISLHLRARASAADLPGTWGFGLWNDPFGLSFGQGGTAARLPALPQAAWFFHASPPNHLTFHDALPADGFLAGTFRSLPLPSILLMAGLPVLLLPRLARRAAAGLIAQGGTRLHLDVTVWHEYRLDWESDQVRFFVDGDPVLITAAAPRAPLGLVLWIDNQYAAFPPGGRIAFGTLEGPAARLELAEMSIE